MAFKLGSKRPNILMQKGLCNPSPAAYKTGGNSMVHYEGDVVKPKKKETKEEIQARLDAQAAKELKNKLANTESKTVVNPDGTTTTSKPEQTVKLEETIPGKEVTNRAKSSGAYLESFKNDKDNALYDKYKDDPKGPKGAPGSGEYAKWKSNYAGFEPTKVTASASGAETKTDKVTKTKETPEKKDSSISLDKKDEVKKETKKGKGSSNKKKNNKNKKTKVKQDLYATKGDTDVCKVGDTKKEKKRKGCGPSYSKRDAKRDKRKSNRKVNKSGIIKF
tara:strand:- start:630 stop:1460 length:831 start_codon:yes stop_codon:yes gene_type:complete